MHGAAYANWAVSGEFEHRKSLDEPMVKIKAGADLLLAFGVRFDDRVTGKVEEFCKTGTIVHIDIDQSEHNKNRKRPPGHRERHQVRACAAQRNDRASGRSTKSSPPGTRRSTNGRRARRSPTA